MLQRILTNWKTTSAGLVAIVGATVHIVYAIKQGTITEETWMSQIAIALAGFGLLAAGDASQSAAATPESNATKPKDTTTTTTTTTPPP